MADRSQINCRTPACGGCLGSWANGQLIPAGHLVGGRDWLVDDDCSVLLRCSRCNQWHRVRPVSGRLSVEMMHAA